MSLQLQASYPISEETQRIARAAFPQGNLYKRMRDELGEIYQDMNFAELFPGRGQKAESPGRLAWVTVMQYSEGMLDRQAAEAVRVRIDWKYVLGLELTNAGFDYSVKELLPDEHLLDAGYWMLSRWFPQSAILA